MADWGNVQQGLVSGFQVGQRAGGKLSGIGMALGKIAEKLKTDRLIAEETNQKKNLLGFSGMSEGKLVSAQPNESGAFNVPGTGWVKKAPSSDAEMLELLTNGGGGASSPNLMGQDWKVNKVDVGPYSLERVPSETENAQAIDKKANEARSLELAKGIPNSEAGRMTLAKESVKNIQDIKKILFPTGEAKSFKRTTAFASNLPGGSLPGLPSRGWGRAEQDVFRKMGAALSGRQLIQTGVAARPEETQKLISQFAPSVGSNPEAALNGLNELENFYTDYMNTVTTKGLKTVGKTESNDPLGLR